MNPQDRDALVKAFGDVARQMNQVAQQLSVSIVPVIDGFRRAFSQAVAEHYGLLPAPEPSASERMALAARRERLRDRESSARPRVRLEPQRAIERSPERP